MGQRTYRAGAVPALASRTVAVQSPTAAFSPAAEILSVVRVDPMSDPRWEAFIAAHPDASIYHHARWIEVLTREYRRPAICLACVDRRQNVRGVLPLLETRGLPLAGGTTGRRISSLPRTPVAGPLARDESTATALLNAAIGIARQRNSRLELRLSSPSCDRLVDGLAGEPWRPSYRLPLPADPEKLRFGDSRNHARIKWALGKAARSDVVVRAAESLDDLSRWYPLYLSTMQRHAAPTRPYRFFTAAWELLRPTGLMQLLLAEQRGGGQARLLAGSMFFRFGSTVFYASNGCSEAGKQLRANDVIQWQAIHEACQAGFRWYDLGEVVESQEGLHEFKRKWGAEAYRVYRYYYPSPGPVEAIARDSHGVHGRLAKAAWRRLPLRVAAAMSDHLYGYL